jgi:PPOX class probable F420-dependent enzyme
VPRPAPFAELARSTFVLLTTYRRNGDAVATPVWVAPDGERLLVTTGASSGKVKRLARTPRVTLTPCDMRGRVREGALSVEAVAVVVDTAEARDALDAALLAKYGIQYRMVRRRAKRRPYESVPVIITAR